MGNLINYFDEIGQGTRKNFLGKIKLVKLEKITIFYWFCFFLSVLSLYYYFNLNPGIEIISFEHKKIQNPSSIFAEQE